MRYLAIDLETTGLDVQTAGIFHLAATVGDTAFPDPLAELSLLLNPWYHNQHVEFEPYAMMMNARYIANIATGPTPTYSLQAASTDLFDFIRINFPTGKVTAAGKNIRSLDLPVLQRLGFRMDVFHHRTLNVGNLFVTPQDDHLPDLKACLQRAGLPAEVSHDALDDCKQVVRCVHAWAKRHDGD